MVQKTLGNLLVFQPPLIFTTWRIECKENVMKEDEEHSGLYGLQMDPVDCVKKSKVCKTQIGKRKGLAVSRCGGRAASCLWHLDL